MRDSGLIIEVDLPDIYNGDEMFVKKRALLLFNGSCPYAMFEEEGRVVLQEIEREVMRYGVTVIGGAHYEDALNALMQYT